MKIPFIRPELPAPDELVEDLESIYKNNYYSNNGPLYFEFKKAIEVYMGAPKIHATVVSNATLGLMMAIVGNFGVPRNPGKLIAVPSFTFSAGPLAIKWCGYEPVFFDIDIATAQPSLESFRDVLGKYGSKVAGLLLTNSFGIGNREINKWEALLLENGMKMVIDSAPGFGSVYEGDELLGRKGNSEIFSFHATKPFGIGEGGLITTTDKKLADRYESIKNFGFDENKATTELGINAKITELDCAIGLRILKNYDSTLQGRRNTYKHYVDRLKGHNIDFLPYAESAAIQFATILVNPSIRQKILNSLLANGVEVRTYYAPPVHSFPLFKNADKTNLDGTKHVSDRVISLPVHPGMPKLTVDFICDIITQEL